jgi:hypothetical protein
MGHEENVPYFAPKCPFFSLKNSSWIRYPLDGEWVPVETRQRGLALSLLKYSERRKRYGTTK